MHIKISVCITAFNHEKFIAQAIESVLMQRTKFDFEVLIGEDDSSDNTRKIVSFIAFEECKIPLEWDNQGRVIRGTFLYRLEYDPNNGWIKKQAKPRHINMP